MKIGQQFKTFTVKEYCFYIDHYTKYTDFNSLGLYRSLLENNKLSIEEKIQVREYAHRIFKKRFDFLQLKDPNTFVGVTTLGQELTVADRKQVWNDVRSNQQKILADKRIKHRNFGIYAKHDCGNDNCFMNGVMARQGTWLSDCSMHFKGDRNRYPARDKSEIRKWQRKNKKQLINKELENDIVEEHDIAGDQ